MAEFHTKRLKFNPLPRPFTSSGSTKAEVQILPIQPAKEVLMNSTSTQLAVLSQAITAQPISERPRERCLDTGASCLSLRECLALILGSGPPGLGCLGVAKAILTRPGNGLGQSEEERAFFLGMEGNGLSYLTDIPGLGPAGQAKLLAAIEIGRRYALFRAGSTKGNRNPSQTHKRHRVSELAVAALNRIPQKERCEPREWLGFIPVYRRGDLGELCLVERGVRTHVNTDPTEIFARLLSLRPQGFFLFHNHPSGMATPSEQDLDLTGKVAQVSSQFGIQLLGHWVVTQEDESWIPG